MSVAKERAGDGNDLFPVGMRILAVDDNPTCLMLLSTLLRRCHYKVTTTNQARTALEILRERKDDFDLVISDVDMPDMDGFKLLELVGLEMDLPVIMLSAHGETEFVMKGITHGACDYLVKPVRMEELKNIWQHVIRKKSDGKDQKVLDKPQQDNGDELADSKLNKKRKGVIEDDEDDCYIDRGENEDPMSQKKPRVVWSVELHGKFVAAVNQLGLDKAVPKKILDIMNVDKLTRENVASHLQKYRLYLKRINSVTTHQALVDTSFVHSSSANGFGAFRSYPNRGFMRRLNSSSNLNVPGYLQSNILHGLPISGADVLERGDSSGLVDGSMAHNRSSGNISLLSGSIKPVVMDVFPQMEQRIPKQGAYSALSEFSSKYTERSESDWQNVAQSSGFGLPDTYEPVLPNEIQDELINVPPIQIPPLISHADLPYKYDSIIGANADLPYNSDFSYNQGRSQTQMLLQPSTSGSSSMGMMNLSSSTEGLMRPRDLTQGNYNLSCFGSLEDVICTAVKQERGWGN